VPPTAKRVVLIHAGVADSRMWRRQAALLRAHSYDVVAPDLPGFGNEPLPTEPFSYVELIARFLPAVLVGNSFGGLVALETALAHPDEVHRLVLVAPSVRDHDWSQQIQEYWEDEDELVEQHDFDAATELTLRLFAQPHVHDDLRPMQQRAYELQAAAATEPTWPDAAPLSELRIPTLVLVGSHDLRDFLDIGTRLAGELPDAQLEIIAGAKHLPSLEAPDAFDRLLLEFLSATR
jgi:3-oxoadipate enol-lactonase